MKYAYISTERRTFPVAALCRVLSVHEQGYYAWRRRPVGKRGAANERLRSEIRMVFAEARQRYGSPRVTAELRERGVGCGRHRVARLMRRDGHRAKAARKYRVTTDSSHGKPVAGNVLDRQFEVAVPNRLWAGDITYVATREGWMYLAVFIDLYSRMVVGWKLGTRLTAELVTGAFERAAARRRPAPGLLVHTDQGSQYASEDFARVLRRHGATLSMSRKGNCWDNAVAESFFHSLKVEAIHGNDFQTRREVEREVFDYIERFYNRKRRHSAIGLRSPECFEMTNATGLLAA